MDSVVWLPGSRTQTQLLWHMGLGAPRQADGMFPDRGSNSCLLHWQVGSLPLSHQGNPFKRYISTVPASQGSYEKSVIHVKVSACAETKGF